MDQLTELEERQLNKQLSFSSMAILRSLKLTTAISKLGPACLWVPRSGCAVPAAECWDDEDFDFFIDAWKQHCFWQMNAVRKMLLFQRNFNEVLHYLL